MRRSRVVALVVAGWLVGGGWGQEAGAAQQEGQHRDGMGHEGGMAPATAAYHAAMQRMMAAPMPDSGDPDRDFATAMIPHHQAAIEMAKAQLQYGKDPAIRKLAEDVIRTQQQEIDQLERWLAQTGQP